MLTDKFFLIAEADLNQNNIDKDKLDETIQNLTSSSKKLKTTIGKTASALSSNEWLSNIRQKMLLPGGLSGSDSPFLKYWQQFTLAQKTRQLSTWQDEFFTLANAINKILFYLRKSATSTEVIASNGVYQQLIDNQTEPQLLVLEINKRYNVYPEVSGNRYRVAIRFLQSDLMSKAVQFTDKISFNLAVCW
jgi:cell division protein ZapD